MAVAFMAGKLGLGCQPTALRAPELGTGGRPVPPGAGPRPARASVASLLPALARAAQG
jgi:hypothetical protein